MITYDTITVDNTLGVSVIMDYTPDELRREIALLEDMISGGFSSFFRHGFTRIYTVRWLKTEKY